MDKMRHEEQALLERLRRDGHAIGEPFDLRFRSLRRTRSDARIYGCCDSEGNIRIRLRSRATGEFLKYSSLLATLCHELAHLRHFDHGTDFARLYRQLLDHARVLGLYRPAGSGMSAPPVVARSINPAIAASAARPRRRRGRAPNPAQGVLFPPDEPAAVTPPRARRAGSARSRSR